MQPQRTLINSPGIVAILFCLLAGYPPLSASEPGGKAVPASTGSGAAGPGGDPGEEQPKDIVDRFFAPLDEAVSDINRDLNKGDTGAAAEPDDPSE